ncbi:MAG: EF-hand domain-containing protein [Candidatus Gastranaerophilales bacterium]|nr:EF-hand domain-containing protein [Candidatus Gastranaerophilales bacterium]
MYDKTKTSQVFLNAQSGVQNALQYLYKNNTEVTQQTVTSNIYNNTTGVNSQFFQMINGQFSNLDTDNDGNLSQEEANEMLTNLSSGLTRDQVLQMQTVGSIDSELAEKILSNFAKMDTNGDGKVSESEINAFCATEELENKKAEQKDLMIKNMSMYYGSSSSSSVSETQEV